MISICYERLFFGIQYEVSERLEAIKSETSISAFFAYCSHTGQGDSRLLGRESCLPPDPVFQD